MQLEPPNPKAARAITGTHHSSDSESLLNIFSGVPLLPIIELSLLLCELSLLSGGHGDGFGQPLPRLFLLWGELLSIQ